MYYLDVDFYRYFIGRDDQSVNEQVMIRRIDQQIRVNKIMFDDVKLHEITNEMCRKYMYSYLEIITTISTKFWQLSQAPMRTWLRRMNCGHT